MKRVLAWLLALLIPAAGLSGLDRIDDNYREKEPHAVHSRGLFTYGFHSNTFHLRSFFLRYNFTPVEDLQFFATVNGYKDTHIPETNYAYILDSVNLYDYGLDYYFFRTVLLSLRGSGSYKMHTESKLLLPAAREGENPAEFDSPDLYASQPYPFFNAPGIRIAYYSETLEIGYSQSDFRHAIPMSFLARLSRDDWNLRLLLQRVNREPLTYDLTNFTVTAQLAASGALRFGDWTVSGLFDMIWPQVGDLWFRLEQAAEWSGWTFAIREIWRVPSGFLFEASVMRNFFEVASLGLFAATDGRYYLGSRIDF